MKLPVNVNLFDVKQDVIATGALPVRSQFIFDPATKNFHPEGLFSEVIFGPIGSKDRYTKFGYIELRSKILHPQVHKNLTSMKSLYQEIMNGTTYAKFDPKEQDLVAVKDQVEGNTGFSFFLDHLNKIKFKSTGSLTRDSKIAVLNKYKDKIYLDGVHYVLPCITRDIKKDGSTVQMEAINKLYLNLLSLTLTLPENGSNSPIFDGIKNRIQNTANLIFEYITNLMGGKHGFARGKLGGRNIALGTRNVITSAPLSEVESPLSPRYFRNDESMLSLIQTAKAFTPLVSHILLTAFFNNVFTGEQAALIDKDYNLKYVPVTEEDRDLYTTITGCNEFIDLCLNENIRQSDLEVNGHYIFLVYDTGSTVYLLRNKHELIESLFPKIEMIDTLPVIDNVIYDELTLARLAGYNGCSDDTPWTGYISSKDIANLPDGFNKINDNTLSNNEVVLKIEDIDLSNTMKIADSNVRVLTSEYSADRLKDKTDNLSKVLYNWYKPKIYHEEYLRPITYGELLYISTYVASSGKYTTATRYPILNDVGIITTGIHLLSTEENREVILRNILSGNNSVILPRYPVIGSTYQESACPHPSTLPGYDGDFDGDMLTFIPLLSNEANLENHAYKNDPKSMVNVSKGLVRGLNDDDINKYTFYAMSYIPE